MNKNILKAGNAIKIKADGRVVLVESVNCDGFVINYVDFYTCDKTEKRAFVPFFRGWELCFEMPNAKEYEAELVEKIKKLGDITDGKTWGEALNCVFDLCPSLITTEYLGAWFDAAFLHNEFKPAPSN